MIGRALAIFSLNGRIARWPYVLLVPALFLSQHLIVLGLYAAYYRPLPTGAAFILTPLRYVAQIPAAPGALMLAALAGMLCVAWLLTALSFRRAATAGYDAWIAAATVAPGLQLAAYAFLALAPTRDPASQAGPLPTGPATWRLAAEGMLVGITVTLGVVALGALFFRTYGFGIFVLSPFVIGMTAGYLANRRQDVGGWATARIVLGALLLGGLALIAAALEGVICLIMAAPLAMAVAFPGALIGRGLAQRRASKTGTALMSVTVLPLSLLAEVALPPSVIFTGHQSVVIDAPPDAVWQALVEMESIEAPPPLPFRLGVSYPVGARIEGEGVGARRIGEFSTGQAVERVTAWQPGRKLTFDVVSSPPAMKELSPYDQVHAPHVVGYFDTVWTSFELAPLPDDKTRLTLRSEHELKLDPVLYWLPITRLVVAAGHRRVLDHVRHEAEAS